MYQQTLKNPLIFSGPGMHAGKTATLALKPAPTNTGIIFIRNDLPGKPKIQSSFKNVISTHRGTNLQKGRAKIATAEHLLASLYAAGIDNVIAEVTSKEIPILDGSAKEFARRLIPKKQKQKKAPLTVKDVFWVEEEGSSIVVYPGQGLTVTCLVDFPQSIIGCQLASFAIDAKAFLKEIAPARTFGFYKDAQKLWAQGLALGASYNNALVVGTKKYLTKPRFKDEVVRHKILDLIGDLALAGRPINAHILAYKPSHTLNVKLAKKLAMC